jgi:hypothetical protein
MIKRILPTIIPFLLVVLLSLLVALAAPIETHYVCTDGNGAGDGLGSSWANCFDGFDAITWDTDEADDGNVGPNDWVYLRDTDGAYRQTLTMGASGTAGKPIVFLNEPGDTPVIKTTTAYTDAANLNLCYDNAGVKVYGAELAVNYTIVPVRNDVRLAGTVGYPWTTTIESGDTTAEGVNNCPNLAAALNDGTFHSRDGDASIYYRLDSGSPDTLEIAVREKAIDLQAYDYITLDGITLYGGAGSNSDIITNFWENVQIKGDDGADNITVQNVIHIFARYAAWFGDSEDLVFTNIVLTYSNAGYYFDGAATVGPGNQTSGPLTITNMHCGYINQVYPDTSDGECIGLKDYKDLDIGKSYFHDNGYADDPDDGGSSLVSLLLVYNARVHHSYFYNSNGAMLHFRGNTTGGSNGGSEDTQVDHCIFDTWFTNAETTHSFRDVALYYADGTTAANRGGGYLKVLNSTFINGPAVGETGFQSGLKLHGDLGVNTNPFDVTISNDVFEELGDAYAIYEDFFAWDRINTFILQNNYARKASGNLIYGDMDTTFDYTLFSDTVTSGTDYEDEINARAEGTASGNVDETDPQLVSTTGGPGNNKGPALGSPLIGTGIDLGSLSAIVFAGTDFTAEPSIVDTRPQDPSWWIGAYKSQRRVILVQ